MRQTHDYHAGSAGLVLRGNDAVLTFLSTEALDDGEVSILLTRDQLDALHRDIGRALRPRHPPSTDETKPKRKLVMVD